MDYTSEVVNITKIKDGFFLGDEATASNLDVIIQFKITHMINAAGSQIINAWESIGIKYLTLNWSEHSNQNLFDQKDEIANRIVNFIDDSNKTGEGLLVHSLRGQNRGCIVVIIYLIKKYRWTLSKSLEFLTNKKLDVEIPKYFLNQLSFFESRLSKIGQGPKSSTWNENGNDGDVEELVIRNTYLNGLVNKNDKSLDNSKYSTYGSRRISWADGNNMNNRSLLCSVNMGKELVYQKDIKPVLSHKKMKPTKSCLKGSKSSSNSLEMIKSNSQVFNNNSKISDNVSSLNSLNSMSNPYSNPNLSSNINSSKIQSNSSNPSTVNYPDNLRFSTNDMMKSYNLYSSVNNPDLKHDSNNLNSNNPSHQNYHLSKSVNFDNSMKTKENSNIMPGLSHLNVTGNNLNNVNLMNSLNNINLNSKSNMMSGNIQSNNINQNSSSNNTSSNNISNTRKNNFTMEQNNPQQRSYSVGNDPNKTGGTNQNNNQNSTNQNYGQQGKMGNNSNQIIYQTEVKNLVLNSINNIYIGPGGIENSQQGINQQNIQNNSNPLRGENKSMQPKNDYIPLLSNPYSSMNNKNPYSNIPQNIQIQSQSNKLTKSGENQRIPSNNFFMPNTGSTNISSVNPNNLKVIDYTQNSNQKYTGGSYNTYNSNYQQSKDYNSKGINSSQSNPLLNKGSTINNYQPELNKKNNFNSNNISSSNTGLLNRPNSQATKQGPIKIQNEYEKKPSTPDTTYNNNISTIKLGSSVKMTSNPQQQYGTIKRSNSKSKNDAQDRPSTAPQKENDKPQVSQNSGLKRLPSPNIKSGNSGLGSSQKNMSTNMGGSINMSKYRSPSPSTLSKNPNTLTLGTMKTAGGKQKWK